MRFCSFLLSVTVNTILLSFTYGEFSSKDWDILLFSQHWPVSVCMQWEEKEPHNACRKVSEHSWTVHGIWPTKLGTEGPGYCNKSLHFNAQALEPIKNDLITYWPNLFNGSEASLWKHEWEKHGTCAVTLETLDSEIKYFSKGLQWSDMYAIDNILSKDGISPNGSEYSIEQIWKAVVGQLGKTPHIQCIKDKKSAKWLLFEIRICFNKSLELVDCDGTKNNLGEGEEQILTNCPLSTLLTYPSHFPSKHEPPRETQPFRAKWLLQLLWAIQMLQWMTL